jgi:antitoxin ParD1/3/4
MSDCIIDTGIILTERFENFVNTQIKSGRYDSISEVVCAGLRVLEERETKTEALRAALAEGENSGKADYSLAKLTAELDK